MNTPWIVGSMVAIVFFAYFEKRAFDFPTSQNTLSRWIYNMGQSWPLSIWLMGMLAGGLAVHFFWHWDPNCISSSHNG
jgi:hypothetical protein